MFRRRRGGAPSARPPLLPGHRGSFLSRRDGGLGAAAPTQGGASLAVLFGAGLMATFPFWCLTASSSWGFSLRGSVSSSPRSSLLHASFLQSEAVGLTAMPIERNKKKIEVVEFKSKHKTLMLLPFACISQALELKERLGALDRWRKG